MAKSRLEQLRDRQEIAAVEERWDLVEELQDQIKDEAEYQQGKSEVEQIQAIAPAGSDLREALYMDMEINAYNNGLDY